MSKKYVNYDVVTKKILGYYDDELHGTAVMSVTTAGRRSALAGNTYWQLTGIPSLSGFTTHGISDSSIYYIALGY